MLTIKELFEIHNADGIDFIPIDGTKEIYKSFTKEEFFQINWYQSYYKFWKIKNGQKKYIDL